MATEINQAKLVRLVKSGKSQAQCADELGVTQGQLGMLRFGQALVEAGKLKKAPATAASVKNLRDKESQRWEFIAAATGLSVAKVKEMYGDKESYIGRGRKPGAQTSPATGRKSKTAPAAKRGGAKRTGAKTGAAKRTGAKRTTAKRGPARARTRAERAARSGNPS